MAKPIKTEWNFQLHSIIIKEEKDNFNSEVQKSYSLPESQEIETNDIKPIKVIVDTKDLYSNLTIKEESDSLISDDQNIVNDVKEEYCCNESIEYKNYATDVSENKFEWCIQNEKGEFLNDQEEKNYKSKGIEKVFIKYENSDELHSELIIQEEQVKEELSNNDGIISFENKLNESVESMKSGKNKFDSLTRNISIVDNPSTSLTSGIDEKSLSLTISKSTENDTDEYVSNMNKDCKNDGCIDSDEECMSDHLIDSNKHNNINLEKSLCICDICNKRFKTKTYLKSHAMIHSGEKPFKCGKCEKSFALRNSLKLHAVIHTEYKLFKCDKCEKSFVQSAHLKRHAMIHTKEKPFTCDKCHKTFTRKEQLKNHSMIHTGEKPFNCDKCEKSFVRKDSWKQHAKVHTGEKPFNCDKCKKSFALKETLKRHAVIHTGEKPFKCNICEKRFNMIRTMKQHAKIHTGERPYKCNKCDKRFTQGGSLKTHKRIHERS